MSARTTVPRGGRGLAAARAVAGLLLAVGGALVAGQGAAAADTPDDFPINAQVAGTSPSPTPSATSSTTTKGSGSGRTGSGGAGSGVTPGQESTPTQVTGGDGGDGKGQLPSTGTDKGSVGGVLAVGGLRTSYRPEANPFAGTLHVEVAVQNLSDEAIEPSVAFSLTTWTGMHLSATPVRPLGRLAPGELRTAEADLTGVGQWTVVDAHMVLTPPEMIGGVQVDPVHRDRWLVATPWFVLVAVGLTIIGVVVWRLATRMPAPAALGATA